jgi:hypothetical protein
MMKRKGVVFNLGSPDEKELYDFCCKRSMNFSGFVKRALHLYMKGSSAPEPKALEVIYTKEESEDESDLMSSII